MLPLGHCIAHSLVCILSVHVLIFCVCSSMLWCVHAKTFSSPAHFFLSATVFRAFSSVRLVPHGHTATKISKTAEKRKAGETERSERLESGNATRRNTVRNVPCGTTQKQQCTQLLSPTPFPHGQMLIHT